MSATLPPNRPRPSTPETGDGPLLTEQQRRPLDVRGASVALSAGAGCGKTTVLTSRFLEALEGGSRRPLASVAAMTFTEKAARELRQRIRQSCRRKLESAPDEKAAFWRSVLRGLEAAPVSTFHEFCGRVLRRHALSAGLDPDFEILDAAIASSVRDESLARCLRRWLAESNADLIELAVEFGLARTRDALGDLVGFRDAGDLAHWAAKTEDEVVEAWRLAWKCDARPASLRRFLDAANACASWFAVQDFTHLKLRARREDLLAALSEIEARIEDEAWLGELRNLAKVPLGLRAKDWPSRELNEEAKSVLSTFREGISTWLDGRSWDEPASRAAAAHGLRYARLTSEARRAYDAAKLARGGLDFDDLLVKVRDLLHDPAVREDVGAAAEFVLVDEFQDTDPVQSEILRLLAGESFTTGRLFVVGDFKQSIYRFRGARPRIFQEFRGDFPEAGRLDLSENFRSNSGVIDAVNALFAEAFPGESPRLFPGPAARPAVEGACVEFVWAEEPGEDGEEGSKDGPSAREQRQVEARWLARLIRSRLDDGWLIRERRSDQYQTRKAHAGDVAFLFRAMTDVAPYEQALAAEGFDFYVVGGSGFYALQEVQDVVNVLSVIEDPFDAVALAGTLRSPFFGLSDDGLFWLGAVGQGGLAERFLAVGDDVRLSSSDRQRLSRARSLLSRWASLKDRVPIAELLDRVLDESGYEAGLLGEFLGDRKRANARKLVRLARRFDARGGFTLADFVARLRADLREPPREEQAATSDEEGTSVRLMSIHQAKGLEFPIVVVPDLNRVSNIPRAGVAFDRELGPLVRPAKGAGDVDPDAGGAGAGPSLGWTIYQALERAEDEAEALRLFYVATTRARDVLILSAGVGPGAKPASPAMRLLDERLDRRTGACRVPLPPGWPEPSVRVTTVEPRLQSGSRPAPKHRPALAAVARVITSTPMQSAVPRPAALAGARLIDLDAIRGLSPHEARLDRLVRAVLKDPAALRRGGLPDAARRAARRQSPRAHSTLVDEAVKRLQPWLSGRVGELIAGAVKLERGSVWSVPWPSGSPLATVFQGWTDALVCDGRGVWSVILFSPPGASQTWEHLRWVLASRVAHAREVGTVGSGWRVVLGEGGGLRGEEAFDAAAVEAALRAAWGADGSRE